MLSLLKEAKVDAILIRNFSDSPDPNLDYLLEKNLRNFAEGFLILDKKGLTFIVSNLEYEVVRKALPRVRVQTFEKLSELQGILQKQLKGKKVGLNLASYPFAAVQGLKQMAHPKKISDVSPVLAEFRAIKKSEEVEKLKKACRVTEKVVSQIPFLFEKGMSERALQFLISDQIRSFDCELATPVMVASQKNASSPHHLSNQTRLSSGWLLVDLGVSWKGYCSDVTRMFYIGRPKAKDKELYAEVFDSLHASIANARVGNSASEVFVSAQRLLSLPLPHAIGHGIGLEEHDFPEGIGEKSKWKLEKNMCLALEPALYEKGKYGLRLEDDILVGKSPKLLTRCSDEIVCL